MNKVILIGNVGKDPEIKLTQNGSEKAKFSLATSKKVNGEQKTQWHKIVTYGKTAEVVKNWIKKGSKVALEGEIEYNEYEGKFYTNIITFNILMLDSKDSNSNQQNQSKPKSKSSAETIYGDEDDDVPF